MVLAKIKSLHAQIEALEEEMLLVAAQVDKRNIPVDLIEWLYWDSDYQLEEFAKAMGIPLSKLMKILPSREIEIKCKGCHKGFMKKAKDIPTMEKLQAGKHYCPVCTEKRKQTPKGITDPRDIAAKRRVARWGNGLDLANMPYDEYLQTDYWKKFSHSAREKAGYVCQGCGASGVALHVHHLTYERRGCEYYEDVKVLCQICHSKIHGRLVGTVKTKEPIIRQGDGYGYGSSINWKKFLADRKAGIV